MAERCYSCANSFGVFNKQLGCKNCGFAFCKKCLIKKMCVPKLGNEKASVCNKCYDLLTGKAQPVNIEPPEALMKRLNAASQTKQDPLKHSMNAVVETSKNPAKRLSKEDAALAERLEKLKEDRKNTVSVPSQAEIESRMLKLKEEKQLVIPSEQEIAKRLAVMRGHDPNRANQPAIFKSENRKTQQEQVDDLLNEICEEVEIDSHVANHTSFWEETREKNDLNRGGGEGKHGAEECASYNIGAAEHEFKNENENWSEVKQLMRQVAKEMEIDSKKAMEDLKKDKELWDRVQRLKAERKAGKGSVQSPTTQESDSDEEKEELETKRIIQQLLEENRLEQTTADSGYNLLDQNQSMYTKTEISSSSLDTEGEADDLPWCCICNEDAVLRCRGCDGDLYCRRCYREGHDREDIRDHQTIPYNKKK